MSSIWIPVAPLEIPFVGYGLGSIPFGVILTRAFGGGDVRKVGSGNIGATNVARAAGLWAGVLTLVLDMVKGAASVLLAEKLSNDSATWMMIGGVAALVGHCFPVWLKFKGGKGVATAAGIFSVLCPLALVGMVCVWVLVVICWRYVSLASISAGAVTPVFVYFLWAPRHAPPPAITFGTVTASLLIIYKHRTNIQRLVAGVEPKFTSPKKEDE